MSATAIGHRRTCCWSEASLSENDGLVKRGWEAVSTKTAPLPATRGLVLCGVLEGFNEAVEPNIQLHPCVFLHNCTDTHKPCLTTATAALASAPLLQNPTRRSCGISLQLPVRRGDWRVFRVLTIDHGRIRPSKSLADSFGGCCETSASSSCSTSRKWRTSKYWAPSARTTPTPLHSKQVIIVRGGPGTGKSVVAVELLVRSLQLGVNAAYVTKNAAATGCLRKQAHRYLDQKPLLQPVQRFGRVHGMRCGHS